MNTIILEYYFAIFYQVDRCPTMVIFRNLINTFSIIENHYRSLVFSKTTFYTSIFLLKINYIVSMVIQNSLFFFFLRTGGGERLFSLSLLCIRPWLYRIHSKIISVSCASLSRKCFFFSKISITVSKLYIHNLIVRNGL